MSKTVDERVVEMRFDNAQFERNVQTSMSTLDKLKQKLNLSGAAKGLDEINSSAKKVDMSGLGSGVEAVSAKFSALQVMGVTALANLTNSAVNYGKKMISALTIDPVTDGFKEYETQMNAVQTILANTQKEGTNVKIVNKALDELNTYADETIYNFTEMTRNIGTFTAAGVKLDTSVSAIKGIANLAAISGSSSQQASTAMYQLSQAIASGTVKLMDWNSVVNAGMGGQVFQDALVRTSEHLQTGAKAAIAAEGSFRESLSTGWLTTEVLTETLDQFSTAADTQQEYEAAVKKFLDQGYTKEEAKQMADMARTAGDAATKVKTFTQLIDTLKEALGSGWAQTWRLIIGDFEEAKEVWAKVSDVLSGFINKASDARNTLLESALGKGFSKLSEKVSSIVKPVEKTVESVDKAIKTVSNLGDVVDEVIIGKFGNGEDRFKALTEAGVNYYKVQNKVNEKLGDGFRYTDEQIASQDKLLGSKDEVVDATKEESKETEKLSKEKKNLIKNIASMTEEQMRAKGYTDEQIDAFKELGKTADKLGMPLDEFIDNMDQINGRWLLLHSFENIGTSIINIFKAIGNAWRETFEPMSGDDLFNIIAGFHKFTQTIKFAGDDVDKLKRTFKGLFALLDIVSTITGGGLKLAFKGLSAILGAFDMDVLDLTANLGDMLVKFRDFLFKNKLIDKGLKSLASGVKMAVEAFKDLIDAFMDIPKVQDFIENVKNIDLSEVGKNIIDGLKNGLKDGITSIPSIIIEIGTALLNAIKDVLGIHSPSTEMYDVGENAILGLVNGLKDGAGKVWDAISGIGSKMLEWIKSFDWSKAFALGVSIALLATVKKMVGVLDNITSPLAGVGDVLSGVGEVLSKSAKSISKVIKNFAKIEKSFSKVLNAKAFQMKAEAIRNLAIALAILAGAVYLLAQLDASKLWSSVGAITVLAAVLVALAVAMDKLTSASASFDGKSFNLKGLKTGLIAIGVALLLMAATVKVMGSMNPDQYKQGFLGLVGLVGAIILVFAAFGQLVKGKSAQNIDKAGKMLISMAVTLLLMVGVCKLAGMLSEDEMKKGAAFAAAFLVFTVALAGISHITGKNIDKLSNSLLKISLAMGLMVGVCKLSGTLSSEEMKKGAAFAAAFLIFVGILTKITKADEGSEVAKLGGLLLSISVSMALMVGVCKLVGKLSAEEMLKGAGFAIAFLIFVKALVSVTKIGKEEQIAKMTGTLIAMSVAIGIMAGVCILLGLISLPALAKGVIAVGILGAILALMIHATKGAEDVKGSIIAMSVAIAVMAVAVAALSFIDPKKLAGATIALSILMGMFALIAKASSSLNGAMGSLIVMTIAIGVLAGVIYLLSKLPIDSVLGVSASLSLLLLSLSASCAILSKASMISPAALLTAGIMTLVVAALAGILYLIRGMDPESAIGNAKALSLLVLALSAACVVLSLASLISPMALIAVGVMTLVVAGLATILYLIRDMNPSSSIGNAIALSTLLLALSASCVILGVAGLMGPFALVGVGVMTSLVIAVGTLMATLGGLTKHFSQLEEFLDRGLPILEKIGYGLGSFFGSAIDGFLTSSTSGLPEIATNLILFAAGLMPFIATVKRIDDSALSGVKSLVAMMALISGEAILEKISSLATGLSSMETFSSQLSAFGKAIVSFSNTVKGNIDETAVTAAASAGKIMAEMASTLPGTGGVLQWFAGEKNMAEFAAQLTSFGNAIVSFSNTVKGNIDEGAVTAAASAGKIMAEMQKSIVPSGGVVQFFTGEKDMFSFSAQLRSFGAAIVSFSDTVSSGIDEGAVTAAASAGKIMSEFASTLPGTGGVVQWFNGEKDMATFGEQIMAFGEAITDFSENTNVDQSAVESAAAAGATMAELQKAIPEDGWFDDKVSIEDFGKKIKKFGKYLVEYSEKVADIDEGSITASIGPAKSLVTLGKSLEGFDGEGIDNFKNVKKIGEAMKKYSDKVEDIDIATVTTSVSSALKLKSLINGLSGLKTDGISNFKVTSIGKSMKAYSESVSGINTGSVASSISSAKQLVGLIRNMSGLKTSGVSSFKTAIDTLAKTNISGAVKAFSGSASKLVSVGSKMSSSLAKGFKSNQSALNSAASSMISSMQKAIISKASAFNTAGKTLGDKLATGIQSKKGTVTTATRSMVSSCSSVLRNQYSNFYSAGKYLVEGFAQGISSNSFKASLKAKAMAKAAYEAAKKELKINSPSKLFRSLGYSVPEGFAQGIDRMSKYVENSSEGMAKAAFNGTENALSKLASAVNNDIDVQPTIRPVVDLSDVRSSANSISSMFNNDSMVGVRADVNAINSSIGNRQNGTNNEVVSAINKLRKDLGNVGNTYYTIDGVTYDDGSNISEAVKTLVRAAKVERRI